MRNRLIVFLLALVIFASIPYEAQAKRTITFENSSSHKIFVAMHYQHPSSGWLTQGWWGIEAKSTRDIIIDSNNNVVYIFGKNEKADLFWSGEDDNEKDVSFYVVSDSFKVLAQNKPSGKNLSREKFIHVEFTGDGFTYEFED